MSKGKLYSEWFVLKEKKKPVTKVNWFLVFLYIGKNKDYFKSFKNNFEYWLSMWHRFF